MQTVIQIGAAVGFQVVDGGQNSGITRLGGNILPARVCYCCVCIEIDQCNIAAGAAVFRRIVRVYATADTASVSLCWEYVRGETQQAKVVSLMTRLVTA